LGTVERSHKEVGIGMGTWGQIRSPREVEIGGESRREWRVTWGPEGLWKGSRLAMSELGEIEGLREADWGWKKRRMNRGEGGIPAVWTAGPTGLGIGRNRESTR